jgi:uncharacterized membrane protein YpjA
MDICEQTEPLHVFFVVPDSPAAKVGICERSEPFCNRLPVYLFVRRQEPLHLLIVVSDSPAAKVGIFECSESFCNRL